MTLPDYSSTQLIPHLAALACLGSAEDLIIAPDTALRPRRFMGDPMRTGTAPQDVAPVSFLPNQWALLTPDELRAMPDFPTPREWLSFVFQQQVEAVVKSDYLVTHKHLEIPDDVEPETEVTLIKIHPPAEVTWEDIIIGGIRCEHVIRPEVLFGGEPEQWAGSTAFSVRSVILGRAGKFLPRSFILLS
jgi:hypothetical protein